MIQDANRHGSVPFEESAVLAQHAQLQGEAAAVIVAPAAQRFVVIGTRQGPVASKIFFADIFR